MAVDEIEPSGVPLEQLRRERAEIFGRIGEGPVDPTWEYRQISGALASEKHYRKGAAWRLDKARESLHDPAPIARHQPRPPRRGPDARIPGHDRSAGPRLREEGVSTFRTRWAR